MPTYDYRCNTCGLVNEVTHSIKETPVINCPHCLEEGHEVPMERLISFNSAGFIFKEWTPSQLYKISRDKEKKNHELDVKQIDRYGSGPRLKPNVAGVEVDSWSDAKKLASEAGINTATYDTYIAKEKSVSKTSGVDDNKWKKAKGTV